MAEDNKPIKTKTPLDDGRSQERRAQKSEMSALIKKLEETTQANKAETETVDMEMFLDQFKNSMKVGDTNIRSLKSEFEKANIILNNQSSTEQEKELAQKQIEGIKETVETEEEKREKLKAQEEANSILNKMTGKLDSVAKGISGFASSALAAGGLLAAAVLFINPELFFDKLSEAINGVMTIVDSITMALNGDISGGFQNLKDNTEGLGLVIGTLSLFLLGPLVAGFSAILKIFKGISKFVKGTFNFFMKVGTFFKDIANSKAGQKGIKLLASAGRLIGKLFFPITAFVFGIKGIIKAFKTEGSIMTKLEAGIKETWTGLVAFVVDLPKWLLGKIVGLFSKEKGKAILDFNTKEWLGDLSEKLFFGPSRAIRTFFSDKASAATANIGSFFSGFSFTEFFQNIVGKVTDFFGRIGDWLNSAMDAAIDKVLNIGNAISNFIKSILKAGLPDPTASLFSVAGVASKIIPSAVYEYAGIDKETGMDIPNATPSDQLVAANPNLSSDVLANSQNNAQALSSSVNAQTIVTQVTQANSSSSSSSSNTVVNPSGLSMTDLELAGASGSRR
tara:strand:- start:42 stop:1733 length:1692 start_codon:yes stop_codon:yes gene_type:complete